MGKHRWQTKELKDKISNWPQNRFSRFEINYIEVRILDLLVI